MKICGDDIVGTLERLNVWTQRTLAPRGGAWRSSPFQRADSALGTIEDAVRRGVGDAPVDTALGTLENAVSDIEGLLHRSDVQEKIQDVPENAQRLLANVRAALDRLRTTLSASARRAEDVSKAVEDTRKALDALSNILPPVGTPSPSP
jgi:hypothetical protein